MPAFIHAKGIRQNPSCMPAQRLSTTLDTRESQAVEHEVIMNTDGTFLDSPPYVTISNFVFRTAATGCPPRPLQ
jgi:hypothetical protein